MKIDRSISWMQNRHPASHWQVAAEGTSHVTCKLSPRNCTIAEGKMGDCQVRGNLDGHLYSFTYGKSLEAHMAHIEREAVFHFRPGARTLGLGNSCGVISYGSKLDRHPAKLRHLREHEVKTYSPKQIVDTCRITGINVIAWTYTDPVVWHEFVVETSRLAQDAGIKTLYKSALYIEPAALDDLIKVIDIFSISLKSNDERFYRHFRDGVRLQPVLNMVEKIHHSGRHLEISQLLTTGGKDIAREIQQTNAWVLRRLGPRVPLHYRGFQMGEGQGDTPDTLIERLQMAQIMAHKAGIKYCYIDGGLSRQVAKTNCARCGILQVRRQGEAVQIPGISRHGTCLGCGAPTYIQDPHNDTEINVEIEIEVENGGAIAQPLLAGSDTVVTAAFDWHQEANAVHIEISPPHAGQQACPVTVKTLHSTTALRSFTMGGILKRIIVSKETPTETGIRVSAPKGARILFYPVLKSEQFPTLPDMDRPVAGPEQPPSAPPKRPTAAEALAAKQWAPTLF